MELRADAAHDALEAFGARLGLSAVEAAAGVHRVINSKMADEIRLVSIRRGYDPRAVRARPARRRGPGPRRPARGGTRDPDARRPARPRGPVRVRPARRERRARRARTVALRAEDATPAAPSRPSPGSAGRVTALMAADRVPEGEAIDDPLRRHALRRPGLHARVPVALTLDDGARRHGARRLPRGAPARVRLRASGGADGVRQRPRRPSGASRPRTSPPPRRRASDEAARQRAGRTSRNCGGYVETPVHRREALAIGQEIAGRRSSSRPTRRSSSTPTNGRARRGRQPRGRGGGGRARPGRSRRWRHERPGHRSRSRSRSSATSSTTIADEMEITLLKSSHSTIVKEALDASAAIFDARGNQIAQAIAPPIHLGMIIPAMRRFVELFPPRPCRRATCTSSTTRSTAARISRTSS